MISSTCEFYFLQVLAGNEAVTSEIVASAHIENYAMKLFGWADKEDRASRFGKNVVKAFYTAGNLFDIMEVFGELTPEVLHARKYSKWKAAYIHNCLKRGEQPVPGPFGEMEEEEKPEEPNPAGGWAQPPPPQEHVQPPPQPAPRMVPAVEQPAPEAACSSQPAQEMSPQDVNRVQKLCKFASSAMDYNDVDTAVKNLTEALQILQASKKE